MSDLDHSTGRRTRDLWLIFGNIQNQCSIDDAVLSRQADLIRLKPDDIARLQACIDQDQPLPQDMLARSELPFAGAASCIDDVQALACRINDRIGRANPGLLAASRLIENKETLYRLLDAVSDKPSWRVGARGLDDLIQVLEALDRPLDSVVIKPAVGTESRGVYRPSSGQTARQIVSVLRALPDIDPHEALIVMPYFSSGQGTSEYCLDGIVADGRCEFCAVHEKTRIHEDYPIHDRAMITPPVNAPDPACVDGLMTRLADAFPIKSFVFHLEVRAGPDGQLCPIDLSFRPGGGLIYRSILKTCGIDIRLAHMYCTLGMKDEMRRLGRARHAPRGHGAIAAVYAAGGAPDALQNRLGALQSEADEAGGLLTFDFSDVSILASASRSIKPNVGLAVWSAASAGDCMDRLDAVVTRAELALEPACEGRNRAAIPAGCAVRPAQAACPSGETITGLVSSWVRTRPDAVALSADGAVLSYARLDALAGRFAGRLMERAVGFETPVGLLMGRSAQFIVAALAVLKAGGCYVPLDKAFPPARLAQMVENAGVGLVVCDAPGHDLLDRFGGQVIEFGAAELNGSVQSAPLAGDVRDSADQLACLLHTSGSTGSPKAVAVTRGAIVNLVRRQAYFPASPAPAVLHAASIAFDASTFEIWAPLLNGGRCVVMTEPGFSHEALAALIRPGEVSGAWFGASLFNAIVEETPEVLDALDWVITGGEVVSPRHVRLAQSRRPDLQIVNGYGPTEAATFACAHICGAADGTHGAIPIGRALDGVACLVLDEALNHTPPGGEGELFIAGDGLARGYIGAPALTAERFLPLPDPSRPGARMYRTGDRVRLRPDGRLDFIGRLDRQVKLRGFRVELDEVEAALRALEQVQDARAGLAPGAQGPVLAAEVQPARPDWPSCTPEQIKAALEGVLPAYMIPTRITISQTLARTATGKRAAFSASEPSGLPAEGVAAPAPQSVEQRLAQIWADVLETAPPAPGDDFFQLGGHSLSAARVLTRIRQQFGVEVSLRDLFRVCRLADQAELIARRMSGVKPERPDQIPLASGATEMEALRARIAGLPDDAVARLLNDAKARSAWAAHDAFPGEGAP
ncbi:MAG: amino acid adenylation domain-containing protein [Oceanicaulis sp.]|nr:amino acid adenylation domain-containing protein [Oceanicaulis sp.]